MKLLFLSSWFPYPPINGAKIRIYNLLRSVAKKHQVTLVSFVNTLPWEQVESEVKFIEEFCARVIAIPRPTPNRARYTLGYFSPLPRHLVSTYSEKAMQTIRDIVARDEFDVLVSSEVGDGSGMAYYASKVVGCPKILDCLEVAVYVDRLSVPSTFQRFRNYLTWLKGKAYLRDLLTSFDICTVPSSLEQSYVSRLATSRTRLEVVPHSLDLEYLDFRQDDCKKLDSLVYNGALSYFPNKDAVQFFLTEIFPVIRQAIPTVELKVLGDPDDFDVPGWQKRCAVRFLGHLRDVRHEISTACVNIVPLRHGSGTRLKIVESMALGTPVISTSKGAEGLDVTPEENILIADAPAEFAAQTIRLLRDPALRKRLAENGRRLVEEKYDWRVIGARFNELVESVARKERGV